MTIAPYPAGRAGFTFDRIFVPTLRRLLSLWTALTAWRPRRRAIKHLLMLSDVQLRDIGISRSEIESAVRRGCTPSRRGPG